VSANLSATLRVKKWLLREWDVTTPDGKFVVAYSGRGQAFESVAVDGIVVAKTRSSVWFVPRFDFHLGLLPASIEVRVWPWLVLRAICLRVADKVCYNEGFNQ
jgi:hypothetical protein